MHKIPQDIIRNDAGFGNHEFTIKDYLPKIPSVFIHGREYHEDIRSIVLVSDWNLWTDSQIELLESYGRAFTEVWDRSYDLRLGGNYIHIGAIYNDSDWEDIGTISYRVIRHSWMQTAEQPTFIDLIRYLDEVLLYGI